MEANLETPKISLREGSDAGGIRRIELVGSENPTTLSEEDFTAKAFLYHAARNRNFQVDEAFDYSQEMVDGATLGSALYATDNKTQAENYASIRPEAKENVHALMPYQARMLDLRDAKDQSRSAPFPTDLAKKWSAFAVPRIKAKISELKQNYNGINVMILHRLEPYYYQLEGTMEGETIDFRNDILDTGTAPFSMVDDIWRNFCQQEGIDGVIVIEGGEGHFQRETAATYAFYNLKTVGTFADWQQRSEGADKTDAEDLETAREQLNIA